jgi:hypothetical protein
MQSVLVIKRQANLDGRDSCTQINGAHRILEPPPRLSTFKQRGGLRNRGCTSSTVTIRVPISTTPKAIPNPPRFSTFKRRGGGSGIRRASSQWIRSKHLDQWCTCDLDLSFLSVFKQRGPFPCHVSLWTILPPAICPSPLFWSMWSLSHLIIHSPPAVCLASFHVNLPLKACPLYLISCSPSVDFPPPYVFPCNLSHTSPS